MSRTSIPSSDLHSILLANLRALSDYCHAHDLTFYATGGTLLGAIRHQGFIPWDDDIDVAMMPDQFNKLIERLKDNPYIDEGHRYKALLPGQSPNFVAFIKVVDTKTILFEKNVRRDLAMGVWIDVFCLDSWPDGELERERAYRKQRFYSYLNKFIVFGTPQGMKYKIAYPFAKFFATAEKLIGIDSQWCVDKMVTLAASYSGDFVGSVRWPIGRRDCYPKSCFDQAIEVPFEDLMLAAPADYDCVLKSLYGDYMKLPPESDRKGHQYELYYV